MPVQDDPVFNKVAAVLHQMFRIPAETRVDAKTTSADIAGWDSLSHALLIMKIEEEFNVDLPLDRIYALNDVGELVQLLHEVQASKASR